MTTVNFARETANNVMKRLRWVLFPVVYCAAMLGAPEVVWGGIRENVEPPPGCGAAEAAQPSDCLRCHVVPGFDPAAVPAEAVIPQRMSMAAAAVPLATGDKLGIWEILAEPGDPRGFRVHWQVNGYLMALDLLRSDDGGANWSPMSGRWWPWGRLNWEYTFPEAGQLPLIKADHAVQIKAKYIYCSSGSSLCGTGWIYDESTVLTVPPAGGGLTVEVLENNNWSDPGNPARWSQETNLDTWGVDPSCPNKFTRIRYVTSVAKDTVQLRIENNDPANPILVYEDEDAQVKDGYFEWDGKRLVRGETNRSQVPPGLYKVSVSVNGTPYQGNPEILLLGPDPLNLEIYQPGPSGGVVSEANEDDPRNLILGVGGEKSKLILKQLTPPGITLGTVGLTVTPSGAVQIFKSDGTTPLNNVPVDLANPQGDLAGVVTDPNGVTLYVAGVAGATDVTIKLAYKSVTGVEVTKDEVRLSVVKVEMIKFQKSSMVPSWKDVDQPYKYLGVYTGQSAMFGVETSPQGISLPDGFLTWGGLASGSTQQISQPFSAPNLYDVVTVTSGATTKTALVAIRDRPTGIGEEAYAALHPVDTAIALVQNLIGTDAATLEPFIWANSAYPGIQHNTIADAARHSYWTCLLSRFTTSAYAIGLTTQHEASSPGPSTETVMDLHNNQMGTSIESGHTHTPGLGCCRTAVQGTVSAGSLWYLDSSYGVLNTAEDALLQPTNK